MHFFMQQCAAGFAVRIYRYDNQSVAALRKIKLHKVQGKRTYRSVLRSTRHAEPRAQGGVGPGAGSLAVLRSASFFSSKSTHTLQRR